VVQNDSARHAKSDISFNASSFEMRTHMGTAQLPQFDVGSWCTRPRPTLEVTNQTVTLEIPEVDRACSCTCKISKLWISKQINSDWLPKLYTERYL